MEVRVGRDEDRAAGAAEPQGDQLVPGALRSAYDGQAIDPAVGQGARERSC
jgi:hypothetical protein